MSQELSREAQKLWDDLGDAETMFFYTDGASAAVLAQRAATYLARSKDLYNYIVSLEDQIRGAAGVTPTTPRK